MTSGQKKYPYIDLGNKLKILRDGLNQVTYAKRLGVALRTYHRYEKGERKIPDGLLKLAILLSHDKTKITYVSEAFNAYIPHKLSLLDMAKVILNSPTEYGPALASNIRALYRAIQNREDLADLKRRVDLLEQQLVGINSGLTKPIQKRIKR